MNEHEEGLLRFIVRERRPRVRHLLAKGGRQDWLAHTSWLDERLAIDIPPSDHNPAGILAAIKRLTSQDTCYVISEDGAIHGSELTIQAALERVIGSSMGTVLSIVPGRVAFYEGEDQGRRFVLHRMG